MRDEVSVSDVMRATGLDGQRLIAHFRRKRDLRELVTRTVPSGGRLLDVGCAAGDISIELAMRGYDVHGIDFEPERLKQAQALATSYGQTVRFDCSSFDDLQSKAAYDAIILGEVIEHFHEPVRVLEDIRSILRPGGVVILTTPNMPSLRNRLKFGLFGVFPDNNPEHLFYFDHRRFKSVTDRAGFVIESFSTRYTYLALVGGPLAFVQRLAIGWFWRLFSHSGDTIFAVIRPTEID